MIYQVIDTQINTITSVFINFDERLVLCVYTILTNLLCVSIIDPQVNHVTWMCACMEVFLNHIENAPNITTGSVSQTES